MNSHGQTKTWGLSLPSSVNELRSLFSHNLDSLVFTLSLKVWVIGEFLSTSYDPRCKPEHIAAMYESLEAVSYETSGIVQAAGSARPGSRDAKRHLVGSSDAAREEVTSYSPALLTALMSAVAKLASR